MRTSSMRPLKYSPHTLSPPIRSGLVEVGMAPETAWTLTCTPFTYNRRLALSYVMARWDQVFAGSGDAPYKLISVLVCSAAAGRLLELLAYIAYESPPGRSLMTTACQFVTTDGFTHDSSVTAAVRSSAAASLTVTQAFVPLNDRALPYRPDVVHAAPEIVPVFPLPEASATVLPNPSLKLYAATNPDAA